MGSGILIAIGIAAAVIILGIRVITRDNVSVKVNAVLYFRVLHPDKAVIQVKNYLYGTSQLAQTTLRSICGQAELDELLAEREKRAKVIHAEGELQAAERLAEAPRACRFGTRTINASVGA